MRENTVGLTGVRNHKRLLKRIDANDITSVQQREDARESVESREIESEIDFNVRTDRDNRENTDGLIEVDNRARPVKKREVSGRSGRATNDVTTGTRASNRKTYIMPHISSTRIYHG